MSLAGHVAFVTGAGRNIGREIVLELARRGAHVVITTRANRKEIDAVADEAGALGVKALPLLCDVTFQDKIRAAARAALAEFGAVDIVVNNAAIRPAKPFLEMTEAQWHHVLAVDLDAAFHTAQEFLPGMVAKQWGRIINITGMNAIQGYAGRAHVSAAKHGLWGLTKALAREFGPKGVTVNAVSPGPIATEHDDPATVRHIAEMVGRVPLGRLGQPREIASLCGWLASEEGGFVSGQMIGANGGAAT
ncbi:MAG: 3-oxoacyl-ACP reductase FabG [Candidatus Rokubacteria bacterium]|nr:3-oxoacyl-ACP reductase FabG [Candidatus Rokubacteria bacterium]